MAGQDAAHSQPPALAAAMTGVGSGWAVQVVPPSRVTSSTPVSLTTQTSGPQTAATCSRPVGCGAPGSAFPRVTQWRPPSSVTARRTGWGSMVTSVPSSGPSERSHGTCAAVSAIPERAVPNKTAPSRQAATLTPAPSRIGAEHRAWVVVAPVGVPATEPVARAVLAGLVPGGVPDPHPVARTQPKATTIATRSLMPYETAHLPPRLVRRTAPSRS
jgi:hypothetical protein